MEKSSRIIFIITALIFISAGFCYGADYVGTDKCATCHMKQYNNFVLQGHAYKLRPANEAKIAGIPLPEGYTWDDISYVIGGKNWKSRYMDKKGYIITQTGPNKDKPGKNQYNLENDTWSDYSPTAKNLKYDCGECHTTGYSKQGNQNGLEGIVGTWKFPGIQCEACHGPGSDHASKPGKNYPSDKSAALCGKCHIRGTKEKIPAAGGFIQHHEQYNEILPGPHKNLACVTCHNSHKKAAFSIKTECVTCHSKQANDFKHSPMEQMGVKCSDCHMPEVTKSAIAKGKYKGDIKTHIFKINLDPNANMFYKEGNNEFAQGFVTVEYACLGCHPAKDKGWALTNAKGVHTLGKK